MKITFIKPNIGKSKDGVYIDEGRMEPLQLGVLAALTPSDFQVELFDDRMEEIKYSNDTDLVAVTVETFTAKRAYEISARYRALGVPVIMGGMHPTLLAEEVENYCDVVVTGDAEAVWSTLLEDFKNGTMKKRYHGIPSDNPQNKILTRRDIFEGKGYLPITLLQFSRGCIHSCNFCASAAFFGSQHYCREIEDVLCEIKNQKRKLLFFVDDNIVADFAKAKALFRALIPLKIKWVSQGSMDMLKDSELMELMVASGCLGLVIGFESIVEDNLRLANKTTNRSKAFDKYASEIAQLRGWGLQTWAAFTLGHDFDTVESIKETCRFAIENKFTFAAFNIIMPYPGTPLYSKLEAENRLLYDGKWWLHPDYRFNYCSVKPKNMTADELTEVSFWCRSQFNSPSSIISRMLEPKTNLRTPYKWLTYLIYNPLFRKEVFKKQGLKFGLEGEDFSDIKG